MKLLGPLYCLGDLLRCLDLMPRCFVRRDFGTRYMEEVDGKHRRFGYSGEYLELFNAFDLQTQGLFVDYGCNTGGLCAELKRRFPGLRVVGLDVNSEALRVARERHPGIDFRSVGRDWEPELGPADIVLMGHSLAFIDDPLGALQAIRRQLSPRGALLIVTPNARFLLPMIVKNLFTGYRSDQNRLLDYNSERLERLLLAAGFGKVEIRTFGELPHLPAFKQDKRCSRLVALCRGS